MLVLGPPLGRRPPSIFVPRPDHALGGAAVAAAAETDGATTAVMASMMVALLSAARPVPRFLQAVPVVAPHSRRVLSRSGCVRCMSTPAKAGSGRGETRRIVFLGTPSVAARSLELLLEASRAGEGGGFEIAAVVSQPASRSGRKMTLTPSPVAQLAESEGIELLTPASAKEEAFLSRLTELQPDLCVTAAYGCFLPQRFLDLPRLGTLNVHPSLLPLYRGAAPLQRCLEAGDSVAGVTVAFTVLKMDAGPVLRQEP